MICVCVCVFTHTETSFVIHTDAALLHTDALTACAVQTELVVYWIKEIQFLKCYQCFPFARDEKKNTPPFISLLSKKDPGEETNCCSNIATWDRLTLIAFSGIEERRQFTA